MLPFVLADIWGTCYQGLLAALSQCIWQVLGAVLACRWPRLISRCTASPAAREGLLCHSLALLLWPPAEGTRAVPSSPLLPMLVSCCFVFLDERERKKQTKKQQSEQDRNLKRQEVKRLGMREGYFGERRIYLFFFFPVTAQLSAALAEIPMYVLAFPLLLYWKRVIRII